MRITVELLKSLNACEYQVDLFEKFLGKRRYVRPTARNLRRAQKMGLDISWAIMNEFVSREIACEDPQWACCYARDVDKSPRDDTRAAACESPRWACCYARDVDKSPRDDTRTAACGDPFWAYMYARDVDKSSRDDTRKAACKDPGWAYVYAKDVDQK